VSRGQPDFGIYAPKTTISGLADLGELAARLGSPVTFDRRGDVVWLDDFESGLSKWEEVGVGTDHAANINSVRARNGGFSCKLTTGKTSDKKSQITHQGAGLVVSKIGVEVSFTLDDNLSSFGFRLTAYSGSRGYVGDICYLPASDELTYQNSEGIDTVFATGVLLHADDELFHTIKAVFDLPNKKYNRVIVDQVTYDLSAYTMRNWSTGLAPRYLLYISGITTTDTNVSNYVDDVIVTQNEP